MWIAYRYAQAVTKVNDTRISYLRHIYLHAYSHSRALASRRQQTTRNERAALIMKDD